MGEQRGCRQAVPGTRLFTASPTTAFGGSGEHPAHVRVGAVVPVGTRRGQCRENHGKEGSDSKGVD